MKSRLLLLSAVLSALSPVAFAGHLVSTSFLSRTVHGAIPAHGGTTGSLASYSGDGGVSGSGYFFSASAHGEFNNVTVTTHSQASCYVTASFQVTWKQDLTTDPTPSIYAHHSLTESTSGSITPIGTLGGTMNCSAVTPHLATDCNWPSVTSPLSGSATGSFSSTESVSPTWTLQSTDANGLKTYVATITLTFSTASATTGMFVTPSGGAGSAIADASFTDSFTLNLTP